MASCFPFPSCGWFTKTSQNETLKTLRQEKKAVIKYLKAEGLYNRRMTYEHMKDLKNVVERSLECEKQKERDTQEIEMKEMKATLKSEAPELKPEEVEKSESPVESNDDEIQHKTGPVAILRPEGPLEGTDGTQIHPGDVPCNPEKVIVGQSEIHEEPKMDEQMEPFREDGATGSAVAETEKYEGALRPKEGEDIPPPLPEQKYKPRIVGFVLKPNVKLEDLNVRIPGAGKRTLQLPDRSKSSIDSNPTPKCLQNLYWVFDEPLNITVRIEK